eukprot:6210686-Pleurochrysis_carterae.AAC.4
MRESFPWCSAGTASWATATLSFSRRPSAWKRCAESSSSGPAQVAPCAHRSRALDFGNYLSHRDDQQTMPSWRVARERVEQ